MVHVVGGRGHGGDQRGVGDGRTVVAEDTAGDQRGNDGQHVDIEGINQGNSDGKHDGPGPPGGPRGKGNKAGGDKQN